MEVDTLSEWVKSVISWVNKRITVLIRTMSRRYESVLDPSDVIAELNELHQKIVDKASINCLMEELGMSTRTRNPTYNLITMLKDEILQNHLSVMLIRNCPSRGES